MSIEESKQIATNIQACMVDVIAGPAPCKA
jgi:hypothetical protein